MYRALLVCIYVFILSAPAQANEVQAQQFKELQKELQDAALLVVKRGAYICTQGLYFRDKKRRKSCQKAHSDLSFRFINAAALATVGKNTLRRGDVQAASVHFKNMTKRLTQLSQRLTELKRRFPSPK